MKRKVTFLITALLILGMVSVVYAESGRGKSKMMHGKKEMSMEDKFFKKIKMIYHKQEELGITEEQMDKIKDVKIALKKDLIRKKADIDLVKVDIKVLMYDDDLDVKAMKALIGKKYDIKKAKAIRIVDACASLRGFLTDKQKAEMKKLKKAMMKKYMSK